MINDKFIDNCSCLLVDVGKISVIGLSMSVESFIILHACRTLIWQFLWFYDFYTRESAAACDCQRLFYHLEYSLLKKFNFFPPDVFGSAEYPGPRSTSDCRTAEKITTSNNCIQVYRDGSLRKHDVILQYDFSHATKE